MAMGHQRKRRACWQRGAVGGLLDVLDEQRNPVGLYSCSSQEFNRCLPLALATFVAPMVMGKQDQISGLLGNLPFGAIEGRSDACLDQVDQRSGLHKSIQLLTNHRLKRFKLLIKETFGNIQPLLTLVRMVVLLLGRRLGGEMLVVPSQHECI